MWGVQRPRIPKAALSTGNFLVSGRVLASTPLLWLTLTQPPDMCNSVLPHPLPFRHTSWDFSMPRNWIETLGMCFQKWQIWKVLFISTELLTSLSLLQSKEECLMASSLCKFWNVGQIWPVRRPTQGDPRVTLEVVRNRGSGMNPPSFLSWGISSEQLFRTIPPKLHPASDLTNFSCLYVNCCLFRRCLTAKFARTSIFVQKLLLQNKFNGSWILRRKEQPLDEFVCTSNQPIGFTRSALGQIFLAHWLWR